MPLSMPDKMIRLSIATYPQPLDVTQFYPALSTYSVARVFRREEMAAAADRFLKRNPFYSRYHLIECEFDRAEDFPLSSFQSFIVERYPDYRDGFLLGTVTYRDSPNLQGIFTAFPMALQDGYRCFHFHQALMRSLKTGKDEFRVGEQLDELRVGADELASVMPPVDTGPVPDGIRNIPFAMREEAGPPLKIAPYLEKVKAQALERSSENLIMIRNTLYGTHLPVGNFLLFLRVPVGLVADSTGTEIRDYCRAQQAELTDAVAHLGTGEDIAAVGARLIPGMLEHPHRYVVNNYGDVSAFDGSDLSPERGLLVKYQWHMPILVLSLMAGERDGAAWTVTIRDRALHFSSS